MFSIRLSWKSTSEFLTETFDFSTNIGSLLTLLLEEVGFSLQDLVGHLQLVGV
jgi:hypothetical protein